MTRRGGAWHADAAWLPGGIARDVSFEAADGTFTSVSIGGGPRPGAVRLPGVVIPGLANAHSHAFHRALRGRTHLGKGSFWSWREQMYTAAARLDPDNYLALATAAYAEMALAGVSAVGEFHYLHHGGGGRRYSNPNAMGEALIEAARSAGVRLTLLDTVYLAGGLDGSGHRPSGPGQSRFSDDDVDSWAARVGLLHDGPGLVVGSAIHSVRAVPATAFAGVCEASKGRLLHVHVSEQPAENEACLAFYGRSPTRLLSDHGVLGPLTTVVHATHLRAGDVTLLGASASGTCLCPTTERDLADGIGPARSLADAGSRLCLGSDQHAVTDLLEEARALEMDERLSSGERGVFAPDELMAAATENGHIQLGWPAAGRLEQGATADLVAVRLDTVRTAGALPDQAIFAATAADVDTVVVGGETVVASGRHRLGDVGALLSAAIDGVWQAP